MFLNSFSVRVVGGKELPGGYVEMEHGKPYRVCIHNHRIVRCDARVEIDAKHVGTWRIEPYQSITLERPAHDPGEFTFYRLDSQEAARIGLAAEDPNLGLVKVTFTPEYWRQARPLEHEPPWKLHASVRVRDWEGTASGTITTSDAASYTVNACYAAGGTGLSGHSGQQFGVAGAINHDISQQTVIHLRLVAARGPDSPGDPRPLTCYSTPVPPAVR